MQALDGGVGGGTYTTAGAFDSDYFTDETDFKERVSVVTSCDVPWGQLGYGEMECTDRPGWLDDSGTGCDWYADNSFVCTGPFSEPNLDYYKSRTPGHVGVR